MHCHFTYNSRDEDNNQAHITWAWNNNYRSFKCPNIIPPAVRHVDKKWVGIDDHINHIKYDQIIQRRYGFFFDTDMIFFYLGKDAGDSDIDQKWSWTIPFLSFTYIGRQYLNVLDKTTSYFCDDGMSYDEEDKIKQSVPKMTFVCQDYDNQPFVAECYLQRQWYHRGIKSFKWLKYFTKPIGYLRCEATFSTEIGPRKNTWKGGTTGCSWWVSDPNSTVEQAFLDYAKEHNITVIDYCYENK